MLAKWLRHEASRAPKLEAAAAGRGGRLGHPGRLRRLGRLGRLRLPPRLQFILAATEGHVFVHKSDGDGSISVKVEAWRGTYRVRGRAARRAVRRNHLLGRCLGCRARLLLCRQ